MPTGLIGDFEIGSQPLWPQNTISVSDFFDRPGWERPTEDNPYTEPGAADIFTAPTGFDGGEISTGTPGFEGGTWPYSEWESGSGGAGDGGTIIIVNDDGTFSIDIIASRLEFYRIEIYDDSGDLITRVPDWISGKLKIEVDKASTLEFTIPASSAAAADLVRPNIVWLRDRWGFVVDTFQVQRRKPRGTADASYYDIYCLSAVAQLGEELVFSYTGGDVPVIEHVTALLDLQLKSNPITLGDIDADIADISLPLFAQDTTVHNALLNLQMALPKASRGRMYVDPQRRLQWRLEIGDTDEQIITRKSNVLALQAEYDDSQVINRVWMYGEGNDPTTRLNLVDAGEAEEYVEDTDSQATYGLQPFRKVDRRFRNAESLLRAANRILEEFAAPPLYCTVELLDIAKADDALAGWRDIFIGGKYRVVDETLGVDTSIEIVGIEVDLARPVPIKVDLTNQRRDLSDLITALVDATNQPLYVDGDRYPTMGRNYSNGTTPDNLRAGDTRWNDAVSPERAEMHDGTDWQELAGAADEYHYSASTKAGLPAASGVPVESVGRVDGGGSDNGMFCVPNPSKTGWDALNFFE